MTKHTKQKLLLSVLLVLPLCLAISCFLYPPEIRYSSFLSPEITSEDPAFAIDEDSLPDNMKTTHRSLFDGSLQGFERTDCQAYSFQGHPEASPGPHDVAPVFDQFINFLS